MCKLFHSALWSFYHNIHFDLPLFRMLRCPYIWFILQTVDQLFGLNLPLDLKHLQALLSVIFHSLDAYLQRLLNQLGTCYVLANVEYCTCYCSLSGRLLDVHDNVQRRRTIYICTHTKIRTHILLLLGKRFNKVFVFHFCQSYSVASDISNFLLLPNSLFYKPLWVTICQV